jgi:hypothetical protein
MTTEALDLLDRLSNPTSIKQAAQDRDRPMDRFPSTHFKADILGNGADLQVEQRTPQGSNYPQTGVWLDIDVKEVLGGRGEPGPARLWVRAPGQRQNGQHNADDNSELGQMMLAANGADASITSIRSLPGRKNVEFTEAKHEYTGRQRNDSTGEWGNRQFSTYYYVLNFRGGAVAASNGATAQAKPTDAAIARALELVKEAGEEGIVESEFNLAASRDPIIKPDKAMPKYLTEGKLVSDHPENVLRDGNKLVWVGSDD